MGLSPEVLAELRTLASHVEPFAEAGQPYVLLKGAALPAGCTPACTDLLLRLGDTGDGYPSKLFLADQVTCSRPIVCAPNWQGTARILERNWHWYSWKVPDQPAMSLLQRVLTHLRPLGA